MGEQQRERERERERERTKGGKGEENWRVGGANDSLTNTNSVSVEFIMETHQCDKCFKEFELKTALTRHKREVSCTKEKKKTECVECNIRFSRPYLLKRHEKFAHSGGAQLIMCGMCSETFITKEAVIQHREEKHALRTEFVLTASAHKKSCELYRLNFPDNIVIIDDALEFANVRAKKLLLHTLVERKFIKASFTISLRFAKPDYRPQDNVEVVLGEEGTEVITMNLRSKTHTLMSENRAELTSTMLEMHEHIVNTFDDFVENGSGWVLVDCIHFDIEIGQCAALGGSCQMHSVEYKKNKIVIDRGEKNKKVGEMDGNRCFFLAIASHFLPEEKCVNDLERFIASEICENVISPVPVSKIAMFEDANTHLDLAINVIFKSEDGAIYPAKASSKISAKNVVNLMLFYTTSLSAESEPILHYARISNISNLLASRLKQNDNDRWHTREKHICFNCFSCFVRKTALEAHVQWCHKEEGQCFVLPNKGDTVSYEKKHKEIKLGYTFFFDFETLQVTPKKTCACDLEKLDKCKHKSKILTEHEAFAFSFLMIDRDSNIVEDITYVGSDAMSQFLKTLIEMNDKYSELLEAVEPMKITKEQENDFRQAQDCHICGEKMGNDRVRDHDHQSGEFIGAAHRVCNFNRVECKKIVGFAHNFSGYDSHIIMKALAEYEEEIALTAIPLNTEKFKMLRIENCVLLDSLAFLGASLEKLVETLKMSKHDFPFIKKWLDDEKKREFILRKGVFPYEFVTNMERVDNTKKLPPRESFFSQLSEENISESDYQHAQQVWKLFECETMRDYTALYVKADTYQLAEVVLELRESILDEFNIDLCHYLSLPMMAKDIMLKKTKVKMELMDDIDMIHFIRSNIRGGLSYVNHRHFHVEEEKIKRGSDTSLVYVDANNLYGAAMRFPMPLKDFQWMANSEIDQFSLNQISIESERGYIFEVTLDYPEELHIDHSSFPLAPHQMEINESHLSEYATSALSSLGKKKKYRAKKLTSTFLRREKYVCHGMNLKLYVDLGMKLVEIHRGISFFQTSFIRPYIDMCTQKRAEATTKTKSNMMKLLSNSLYGKVSESEKKTYFE